MVWQTNVFVCAERERERDKERRAGVEWEVRMIKIIVLSEELIHLKKFHFFFCRTKLN